MPCKQTHLTEYSKTVGIEQHAYMLGCRQGSKGDSGKTALSQRRGPQLSVPALLGIGKVTPT